MNESWIPGPLWVKVLSDEEAEEAYFDWENYRIVVPSWNSFEHALLVLHELGHAHYKHVGFVEPLQEIQEEEEAWNYALSCLQPRYQERAREYIRSLLKTYLDKLD